MAHHQAETDRPWRHASWGFVPLEKISYRGSQGDFKIPDASAWLRVDLTLSGSCEPGV